MIFPNNKSNPVTELTFNKSLDSGLQFNLSYSPLLDGLKIWHWGIHEDNVKTLSPVRDEFEMYALYGKKTSAVIWVDNAWFTLGTDTYMP